MSCRRHACEDNEYNMKRHYSYYCTRTVESEMLERLSLGNKDLTQDVESVKKRL